MLQICPGVDPPEPAKDVSGKRSGRRGMMTAWRREQLEKIEKAIAESPLTQMEVAELTDVKYRTIRDWAGLYLEVETIPVQKYAWKRRRLLHVTKVIWPEDTDGAV
jgi:hypothetical protein